MIGRLTTWRMLFNGLRQLDGHEMGLLSKICEALDQAWEDYIYDPASELPTLFEVNSIDAKWLPYLKPLLGFTRDLPFDATEEELRRVLARAVPFWNDKPSELGVITHSIRMVTGNRYRVRNFFDFRMAVDETVIGDEMEDFDPWCIDFWGYVAKDVTCYLGADGDFNFNVEDPLPGGLFFTAYDYRFLVVEEGVNAGTYPIAYCNAYYTSGMLAKPLVERDVRVRCSLYGAMDEYLSEVRLVDDGTGTLSFDNLDDELTPFLAGDLIRGEWSGAEGVVVSVVTDGRTGVLSLKHVYKRFMDNEPIYAATGGGASATAKGELRDCLNRKLLRFLIGVVRPLSERIRVVYVDLLDEFETPNDLDQWTVTQPVSVPSPGGAAAFGAGGKIITNTLYAEDWKDATIYWKVALGTSTSVFRGLFRYVDADNHYALQLSMATKKLRLVKRRLGVESTLAETAVMPWLKAGVQDVIRVDVITLPSTVVHFKVTFGGEPVLSEPEDPSNTFVTGKVGASCTAGSANLKLVEAAVWPMEADHVGPPPTEITYPGLPDEGGGEGGGD